MAEAFEKVSFCRDRKVERQRDREADRQRDRERQRDSEAEANLALKELKAKVSELSGMWQKYLKRSDSKRQRDRETER